MPDFRLIPSIDQLRQRPGVRLLEGRFGVKATLLALRQSAARLRERLRGGAIDDLSRDEAGRHVEDGAASALSRQARGSLRRVVNATGVVIHTNLGRAPLGEAAIARIAEVARGYSNLEYDLAHGGRGSRTVHAEALVTALTGAEAAVVVNNNAAAMLLMLAGLAAGREVVISRGELVEIGGGFRVPDLMRQSGADLREVGTTNRTRVADYTAAVSPRTALILRVHPSNFRMDGFTERPALADLVAAGQAVGVPVAEDLGGGALTDDLPGEPPVQASIGAGVGVVCFSGDKLLGGPQAGIIAGQRALMDRLRAHPLMRALRVDKLTLAALEATLIEHVAGRARENVPVQRMLHLDVTAIETRARALAAALGGDGWHASLVSGWSEVGGGSAPGLQLPTLLVALEREGLSADALDAHLRALDTPIIGRIDHDRLVLDLRTVDPSEPILELLRSVPLGPPRT